jgi:hypothetical protein
MFRANAGFFHDDAERERNGGVAKSHEAARCSTDAPKKQRSRSPAQRRRDGKVATT